MKRTLTAISVFCFRRASDRTWMRIRRETSRHVTSGYCPVLWFIPFLSLPFQTRHSWFSSVISGKTQTQPTRRGKKNRSHARAVRFRTTRFEIDKCPLSFACVGHFVDLSICLCTNRPTAVCIRQIESAPTVTVLPPLLRFVELPLFAFASF